LLLEKLQTSLKTVAAKSTIPVLSGILIKASGEDTVELASTDMELSLRISLPARVEGEGAAVLPGRLFTDIVRSLPAGEVTIGYKEAEQLAAITSSSADFHVNCLPAGDFPSLPAMPGEGVFGIEAAPLIDTINTVARAASRDETRPVLTGVLVKFSREKVKMVATDSYRLGVRETQAKSTVREKKEVIVPRASLEELARLSGAEEGGEVEVAVVDGQILFRSAGVLLASRLIEGKFPNYQQLLPEEFKMEVEMDREELTEIVSRVGLMAQKNAPLRLRLEEGRLEVSAQTPQVGEARESMPVPYKGEEVEIGFNPEFLKDGIESVDEDKVSMRLISPLRPGLLKGKSDSFLYLIMPVRLTT
jgi:DNA polymerase-3 subunit beta